MTQKPSKHRLQELAHKWLRGNITPSQQQEFNNWFLKDNEEPVDITDDFAATEEEHRQKILDLIHAKIREEKALPIFRLSWRAISVAAAILIFLSIGTFFLLNKQPVQEFAQNQSNDIAPGGNRAILTLANNKKISLTDAHNGVLAQQGNININKTADGQVTYAGKGISVSGQQETVYNTMTTPRGGKYTLILADGTVAVLDAASSITYPVAFYGKNRKVEITGQVYFEVVHNSAKPFVVSVRGQTIEDLGTHFNINAYDDEPVMKTTLLEGGVKLSKGTATAILKPGQQGIIQLNNNNIKVKEVDIEDAIAWKDGLFRFSDESLESILRKVSRWYDVDIEYTDNSVKSLSFGAVITRFTNVSKVLGMLELTKEVHFRIQGKKIIVMK
jgi:ferric-dicitrate binding protein FerR (iron transport regulator)